MQTAPFPDKQQIVICICGLKNTGKTTLAERLTAEFTARRLRVAYIKHDGHDFSCDLPGTDSARLDSAGAYGTAVFSAKRVFLHKRGTGEDEVFLRALFPEADVILTEGLKDSVYPKIEVIRKGIADVPVSNPLGRFLIVTDYPAGTFDEACAGFDETGRIADLILSLQSGNVKQDQAGHG